MDIKLIKTFRYERYFMAFILICLMITIAEISGQKEVIFPEVLALALGSWIADIQPWRANKRKIFTLMVLASVIGISIVRYIDLPMIFQVLLGYLSVLILLYFTKTDLIPILSACILPIYTKTTTLVYPLSVGILALVIIFGQYLMEKFHIRAKNNYEPIEYNLKDEIKKWGKLLLFLAILATLPMESKNIYFLAPPLIVTYTAFSNPKSKVRLHPFKIYFTIVLCAILGSLGRILFDFYLNLPMVFCAIFACTLIFIAFEKSKVYFPPSGAILLIPLILDKQNVFLYPPQVAVGAFFVIASCFIFFNKKS